MDIKINSATNFKSGMNAQILRMEKNIVPEFYDNDFIVLMASSETTEDEISYLCDILSSIPKKEAIQKHLDLLKTYFRSEKTLVAYFKKHLMWYVKNTNYATATKIKILEYSTLEEVQNVEINDI